MKRHLTLVLGAFLCAWGSVGNVSAQPFDLTLIGPFVRPIGVAAVGDKVYITNYCTQDDVDGDGSSDGWALWQLECDGTGLSRVGNFTLDVPGCGSGCQEIYLAVSLGLGGWTQDIIYAIHGDQIFEISPDGSSFSLFVDLLPGQTRCTHSGITFDDVGTWGLDMIATLQTGEIFRVKADGTVTLVTDVLPGTGTCEGPDVAPLTFGTEGGNVCITCESQNQVKMVRPDGTFVTIATPTAPESCHFIPDEPCDCQGQFGFYTANFPDQIRGSVATDLAAGAGNLLITAETASGGASLITPSGITFSSSAFFNPPGRQHEGSALVECALVCNDPDPRSQGYWHRQCLGLPETNDPETSGIDPGRNGRGPQEPTDPTFEKELMPAVSSTLQSLLFEFQGTCGSMDAEPASDPCERALKQFTAMLLNLESGGLQNSCSVDPNLTGCNSDNLADLVDEIADLINDDTQDSCNQASACAVAVNEGLAGLEGSALRSATASTSVEREPRSAGAALAGNSIAVNEPVAEAVLAPDSTGTAVVVLVGTPEVEEREAEKPAYVATDKDSLDAIQGHLTVLAHSSSREKARSTSTDALLTTLSGGYEPETRLEIVKALLGKVDVAYESLLADHLRDIVLEAKGLEKEDLANEAARLLKRLEPSEE